MKNYTELAIVLDRSGSMGAIKDDTIGGFNQFIEDQKKSSSKSVISLYQFDDSYECIFKDKDKNDVPLLTDENYKPNRWTALLDAIGKTIVDLGKKLAAIPEEERPERVCVVVITDGYENASTEFLPTQISHMITRQQDVYKWQFVFLGANQDAILSAQKMAINIQSAMTFAPSSMGVRGAFASVSENFQHYAGAQSLSMEFTGAQIRAQEDLIGQTDLSEQRKLKKAREAWIQKQKDGTR